MKRILSTILLCVTILCAYSQEDITLFFLNDGSFKGFYDEEIDSITYSHLDLDSIWHTDAVVQEVWLADSVVRIPIEKIDSICHKVPDPEYKPGVIHLDERYLPYITSVDGLTISFSSGLSENLWPKEGSVLLYEGSNNIFPNGFAGTVTKLVDGVAVCDSAAVDDVYERLYFFGSYVLAEDGEGTGTYSAKKIRSRHADDKEDDWGIFEVDPTNIPFDKIKIAEKIDISRANMFVAISGTITPTVTVEAAYVFNVYEPLIFFKATHRFEYDALLQVGFNKDFTPKHHKDIGKPFRMHKLDENRDEKGFHLYFINESVPIPQCPVLTAGFKMGLFIDPKIEAEVVLGLHIQASEDKTHIYRLDKNNIGRLGEWWKGNGPEPETSSCEIELDGSLTGSVWAGLMAAINVGVGTDKCGMKEELSARIGPYIEGKLNLDFMDLNKDMSWYSGLKDSKIKRGIKSAFNLDFTAKMPKVFSYKWTQLELSPPKLFFEQDCYLLPAFEAPTYSVQGNSLKCYTSVTRSTVPNHIGLRVKDESGKEVTKWQNFTFDFADKDNPYVISETFDNLDFANHRYTIIPVTRIWELPALEIPEPSQTCVTCPDSRHPHLIDLGLPSGTKWLCQNVYADDPKDAGGYYQWGKPFMVHAYTDLTYRAPSSAMANYQSSEHDAATANLGQEYCTPTMSQFNELHDNCSMDYKYSPWGNNVLGVFLKGKNGNNLYLPFSGFKSGVKVNNKSEGCFLSSDAVDSDNNLQRKAVVIKNNDAIWHSTDALAYGYSVRPVSAGSDGLVIEPQQLDYEVIVGQKVGQSVTVTNNGSAPVSVTVTQTTAPFQVDNACLGTFTVSPKKQQSVLVYFSPTEEKEYTSVLTLSYEKGSTRVVSKVSLKGKGVNSSNIPLKLSATTLSLTAGQQGTVNITSGSGSYAAVSNATNIATVTVEGSKLIIKAVVPGTATITVKDNQTQERAKIEVEVTGIVPEDAYAVYKDGILTFYGDNNRFQRDGEIFDLNLDERPGWNFYKGRIKQYVFDDSFSDVRPVSMLAWFSGNIYGEVPEFVGVENLNTSCVTTMKELFNGYYGYRLDLRFLDTSNVTDMTAMFNDCERLRKVDLSSFDTGKVHNMSWMFADCENLEELDLGNFDTSNVESMRCMFSDCHYLEKLDLRSFNTSKVKDMWAMFWGCWYLETLNITSFDTSNVTNMGNMFDCCSSLVSLDVSNFNTSNVKDISDMFRGCSSIKTLDVSHFDTSNVEDFGWMFLECSSLTHLDVSNFNTSKSRYMWLMFNGCSSLTSLDVSHFDTSNVRNMSEMFQGCSSLTSLDVSNFNTSNVQLMDCMFDGCTNLQFLDVGGFNTSNVTDMSWMFRDCKSLARIDVSNFDTSKVHDSNVQEGYRTGLEGMFYNCANITSLDLSGFVIQEDVITNSMFYGCNKLKTIYVRNNWDLTKVKSSSQMFEDCISLVGGKGTKYNSNHIDGEYARIDGGSTKPGYFTAK